AGSAREDRGRQPGRTDRAPVLARRLLPVLATTTGNGRQTLMRKCERLIDIGRRQFLRGGATAAAAGVVGALTPAKKAAATPAPARVDYPAQRLANVADLEVDRPLDITYPDPDSPGVLLKLGRTVEGGAGPDGDIVAFSTMCPHKGFPLHYVAADKTLNC